VAGWPKSVRAGLAEATVGRAAEPPPDEQACPGIALALSRVLAGGRRPEVLDLGQPCRASALYVADRGARVYVDDFAVPEPPEPGADDELPPRPPPIALPHGDARFDLVLGWDHADQVPPERLAEFGAELARVLAPGGWLVLFVRDAPGAGRKGPETAQGYRLVGDDRFVRVPAAQVPVRRRFVHPSRAIERALAPLKVRSVHLQRNGVREFLLHKPQGT